MAKDAWIELTPRRADKVWDRFDEAFRFRPSVRPEDWPSFREPPPSATWDISDLLAAFCPWRDPQATPYNLALLQALKECVPEDEPVLALDWQHAAYAFYPHRFRAPEEPGNWLIPALPAGEYHIFITDDHRLGSLGHPWVQTLCVFGSGFVESYRRASHLGSDKIIRQQVAAAAKQRPQTVRGKGGGPRRRLGRRP
jgi:hypothetical protein